MKKNIGFLVAGLMFTMGAGSAMAAAGDIAGDMTITPQLCTLLSNDVAVKLSKGNQGAFACTVASSSITAGVCSANGANKSRTETCSWIQDSTTTPGTTVNVPNDASCGTDPTVTPTPTFVVTNRVAYVGNSAGGKVAANSIGTACTSAAVKGISTWPAHDAVQ